MKSRLVTTRFRNLTDDSLRSVHHTASRLAYSSVCLRKIEKSMRFDGAKPGNGRMIVARMTLQDVTGVDDARSVERGWSARARPFSRLEEILPLLEGLDASPFQSPHWLSAWMEVFGGCPGVECFLVTLESAQGVIALALPLVRRREAGLRVLEGPDFGVTDYTAPLIRRAMVDQLPAGDDLLNLIKTALPAADMLRLNRLCPLVQGMANPLYAQPWSQPNRMSGWRLPLPDSWAEYRDSLSARMRDKLAKNGRRFARTPANAITLIHDLDVALAALATLDAMQADRIKDKGLDYHLNAPLQAAFYRRLVEQGITNGRTVMVALRSGDVTVAANFAVRHGTELVYLRVANLFGEWGKLSPGLLATEHLIREEQAAGVRVFDFAMGNYDYKRRFGAEETPLVDLVLPLSLKGWLAALTWHAMRRLSRVSLLRRLTGRTAIPCPRDASDC